MHEYEDVLGPRRSVSKAQLIEAVQQAGVSAEAVARQLGYRRDERDASSGIIDETGWPSPAGDRTREVEPLVQYTCAG